MEHKKRERKRNFSQAEIAALTEYVAANKEVLFGKAGFCGARVEERKRRGWAKATQCLRAAGGPERDWAEARKKWQELKTKALSYRADKNLTGGGPAPKAQPIYDRILEVLAPETAEGIVGSQEEAGFELPSQALEVDSGSIIEAIASMTCHNTCMTASTSTSSTVAELAEVQPITNIPTVQEVPYQQTTDRHTYLLENINSTLIEILQFMKSQAKEQ